MRKWAGAGVLAFMLVLSGVNLAQANLITNGGFETGDFTGWTLTGNTTFLQTSIGSGAVHSGLVGVLYGNVGTLGFLSQIIPTTPGESYILDFWEKTSAAGGLSEPNELQAYWNGSLVLDLVNSPVENDFVNHALAVVATGATTEVKFGFRSDPSFSGFDDASVNAVPSAPSGVPEPSTWILLATGLAGVLGYGWKKRAV